MSPESTGYTKPLLAAAIEADIEKLMDALAATPPPTASELRTAALNLAGNTKGDCLLGIKLILDRDASIRTALAGPACRYTDVELLQLMHDYGWGEDEINVAFSKPHRLLISAVRSVEVLRWLLDHGLDANLPGQRGITPGGANTFIGPMTPLSAVANESRLDADRAMEEMELLVSRGAVVDYNVLINAIYVSRITTIRFQGDVLRWILQHAVGFDINTRPGGRYPLLHDSIVRRRQQLVAWLLENGADISIRVRMQGIRRLVNALELAEEVGDEPILEKVKEAANAQSLKVFRQIRPRGLEQH